MKDSRLFLDLVIGACDKAVEFIGDLDDTQFSKDRKTQSAVIMQLHVIGEEAKKIDDATRAEIQLPWEKIIGLRNIISHQYFALELPLIWETTTTDLPRLSKTLREYLLSRGKAYTAPAGDEESLM